jgi:hypothetical protein
MQAGFKSSHGQRLVKLEAKATLIREFLIETGPSTGRAVSFTTPAPRCLMPTVEMHLQSVS